MKRLSWALLICLLSAHCASCVRQGGGNKDVGDRRGAAKSATREADSDPTPLASNQFIQFVEAKVKISQGKYHEAVAEIDSIRTDAPEEQSLKLVLLGESYEGLVDSARAFAAYKKAQRVAPPGSVAMLREAVLDFTQGDLVAAEQLLRRYIRLEPGNPEAYYYLFLCVDDDSNEQAVSARMVAALDGPTGAWSTELLKTVERRAAFSREKPGR